MENTFIYALVDPRCGELFYIGKANVPQRRLKHHLYSSQRKANVRFTERVEEIKASDLKPLMLVLEECDFFTWKTRERYWIKRLRNEGAALLNLNDGGIGGPTGTKHPHSDSVRALLRRKNEEQFSDPERRRRHREGVKRWVDNLTEQTRVKLRAASKALEPYWTPKVRSGVAKNFWASMNLEERKAFCAYRALRIHEANAARSPEGTAKLKAIQRVNGQKGFEASREGRRRYWYSLTAAQRLARCSKMLAARGIKVVQ